MKHRVLGAIILLVSFGIFYFKPFDFEGLPFILGLVSAFGIGFLFGVFQKK